MSLACAGAAGIDAQAVDGLAVRPRPARPICRAARDRRTASTACAQAPLAAASLGKAPSWTSEPPDAAAAALIAGPVGAAVSLPPDAGTAAVSPRRACRRRRRLGRAGAPCPSTGASGDRAQVDRRRCWPPPSLVANAVSPSPSTFMPAGIVGLDLVVALLRRDQRAVAVRAAAASGYQQIADDRRARSPPARAPPAARSARCDGPVVDNRPRPFRARAADPRRADRVLVATRRHQFISWTASTPMMPRPLRIICPIASRQEKPRARQRRHHRRSGSAASGSSLPTFHSAWNAAAKS